MPTMSESPVHAEHAGRVYLVTGGSRGLGFGAAQALVENGARVVIIARDPEAVAEAVAALGPSALGLPGDLGDVGLPARAIDAAVKAFGRLDGALLSTGGPGLGSVLEVSDEKWRQAFDTTFLSVVRMIRVLADHLGPGSAIGVVLSTSVFHPIAGLSLSNGLRPGLAMLVKDAANELGPRGIRVVGLAPGSIATERERSLHGHTGSISDSHGVPLGRKGTPREFGEVAAFLLSPRAAYVTGTVVPVDGGAVRVP